MNYYVNGLDTAPKVRPHILTLIYMIYSQNSHKVVILKAPICSLFNSVCIPAVQQEPHQATDKKRQGSTRTGPESERQTSYVLL